MPAMPCPCRNKLGPLKTSPVRIEYEATVNFSGLRSDGAATILFAGGLVVLSKNTSVRLY